MTADEAIFKMLVQVLQNQLSFFALQAARAQVTSEVWNDKFIKYVTETEELLEKVMEE